MQPAIKINRRGLKDLVITLMIKNVIKSNNSLISKNGGEAHEKNGIDSNWPIIQSSTVIKRGKKSGFQYTPIQNKINNIRSGKWNWLK